MAGTPHVVEPDFAALGALVAELAHVARHLEPRRSLLDQHDAHPVVYRLGIRLGLHQHRKRVGVASVGDPDLCTVDDVFIAVAPGPGLDALEIGAGIGLGEGDPGAALAGGQLGKVPLPLLLGAVAGDHRTRQRMTAEDAGDAHPAPRDLLEHQRHRHDVDVQATVLLGHGESEQPHLLHLVDDLAGIAAFLLPLPGHRANLLVDELAECLAKEVLLGGQLEVHLGPSLIRGPVPSRGPPLVLRRSRAACRERYHHLGRAAGRTKPRPDSRSHETGEAGLQSATRSAPTSRWLVRNWLIFTGLTRPRQAIFRGLCYAQWLMSRRSTAVASSRSA